MATSAMRIGKTQDRTQGGTGKAGRSIPDTTPRAVPGTPSRGGLPRLLSRLAALGACAGLTACVVPPGGGYDAYSAQPEYGTGAPAYYAPAPGPYYGPVGGGAVYYDDGPRWRGPPPGYRDDGPRFPRRDGPREGWDHRDGGPGRDHRDGGPDRDHGDGNGRMPPGQGRPGPGPDRPGQDRPGQQRPGQASPPGGMHPNNGGVRSGGGEGRWNGGGRAAPGGPGRTGADGG